MFMGCKYLTSAQVRFYNKISYRKEKSLKSARERVVKGTVVMQQMKIDTDN